MLPGDSYHRGKPKYLSEVKAQMEIQTQSAQSDKQEQHVFVNSEHAPEATTNLILAALRHLQHSILAGVNLSHLEDFVSPEILDPREIDELCERINFSTQASRD